MKNHDHQKISPAAPLDQDDFIITPLLIIVFENIFEMDGRWIRWMEMDIHLKDGWKMDIHLWERK